MKTWGEIKAMIDAKVKDSTSVRSVIVHFDDMPEQEEYAVDVWPDNDRMAIPKTIDIKRRKKT